jgi:hypothetical protein
MLKLLSLHNAFANKLHLRWASHYSRVTGKPASSGFSFTLYDSIAQLPKIVWDNTNNSKDIFLSTGYLTALEQAPPGNMSFRYVIISKENVPAGIAYFQILELNLRLHQSPLQLLAAKKKSLLQGIHNKIADTATLRLLICGNAMISGEHGFCLAMDIKESALQVIAEIAYEVRKSIPHHISVTLIKDFYNRESLPHHVLSNYGFYSFDAGPNMAVPIRKSWLTFENYIDEMKPKYKKRALSAIKKGAPLKRRSLSLDEINHFKEQLYNLYCRVAENAKFRIFVLSPDFFVELKKQLGDRFICEGYFRDSELVAYTTRIFNGAILEGYSHGVNYEKNKEYEIYQNILLDDVRAAISSHAALINTGRTSIAMKSSTGAIPKDMTCYMRFSGKLSNHIIKPLFSFVKTSNELCRNPFE